MNVQSDDNWIFMYSYKDNESNTWDVPFFSKNCTNAKRKFLLDATANKGENILGKFTSEFDLYLVARFNIKTGETEIKEPELLIKGSIIGEKAKMIIKANS